MFPPEEYCLEAGWELTEDGQRIDLFYTELLWELKRKILIKDEPVLHFLQAQK